MLLRGARPARYRIEVDSNEGGGAHVIVAEFELARAADGRERVTLLRVARGSNGAEPVPIEIERECRRAFGGDEADGGAIGRFDAGHADVGPGLVPLCVPEPVYGVVTDIVSLLVLQSERFGARALFQAGDAQRFEPFSVDWQREPTTRDARIDCAGGKLALEALARDRAVLVWTPDPMPIAILRDAPNGGAHLLLAGLETIELEVTCDPRDGSLLEGRSRVDRLDLRVWMPFEGERAPLPSDIPRDGGFPLVIERTITLRRLGRRRTVRKRRSRPL